MANYGLKYYKNFILTGSDKPVRLEILQRDYNGSVQEIGTLNGLSLDVQGSNSAVYESVTKTSLVFSVVDANELTTSTKKCGLWEEFYTPDSTLYLVQLKLSNTIVWSGYVTPDSWEEELKYHATITITARDMLGALDDIEFDLKNKVSIRTIVNQAFVKGNIPMELAIRNDEMLFNTNGQNILDARISASAFKEKSWWEAVTTILENLGLVMRWNGHNKFVLTSARHLQDIYDTEKEVRFINGSGVRTLDAACKELTDKLNVDTNDYEPIQLDDDDLTIQSGTLLQEINIKIPSGYTTLQYEQDHYSSDADTGWMTESTTKDIFGVLPFTPSAAFNKDENAVYLLPNIRNRTSLEKDSLSAVKYADSSLCAPFKLVISLGGDIITSDGEEHTYQAPSTLSLDTIDFRLEAIIDNRLMVYAYGSWMDASTYPDRYETLTFNSNKCEYNINSYIRYGIEYAASNVVVKLRNLKTKGYIEWYYEPQDDTMNDNYPSQGLWTPILIGFEQKDEAQYDKEYITTTKYNESYNVKISRDISIGSADVSLPSWIVSNILSYGGLVASNRWHWKDSTINYPLSVMVHRQLLCFYAAAASVLTGSAILNDKKYLQEISKFSYRNRHLVLNGGNFDCLDGVLNSSNFREYYRYADIWEDGGIIDDEIDSGEDIGGGDSPSTPIMPIALSVSPSVVYINGTSGKTGIIAITADNALSYTISSDASWLTASASSGQGSMNLTYYVSELLKDDNPNSAVIRSGKLTIGTASVTFIQDSSATHLTPSVSEGVIEGEIDDETIS